MMKNDNKRPAGGGGGFFAGATGRIRLIMLGLMVVAAVWEVFNLNQANLVLPVFPYYGDITGSSLNPTVIAANGQALLALFREIEIVGPSLDMLAVAAFTNSSDLIEEPITDPILEAERCDRYHYTFDPNRTTRRRVFWGCSIADDSWHAIFAGAMEYRGLLSGVAFIESNQTQSLMSRTLRYPPGSIRKQLIESKVLWGDTTSTIVDYYYFPPGSDKIPALALESNQRNAVFDVFKRQGMTTEDLAIVSDPDETFTRDFLYALKTCEVPVWKKKPHDCLSPKVLASTIVMESTPICISKDRTWWHPDIVIGECVLEIGDATLHPPVYKRVEEQDALLRAEDWKEHIPKGKLGPLWPAIDFRKVENVESQFLTTGKYPNRTNLELHTGVHLHNYFDSLATLRNKYMTYGHSNPEANRIPLHALGGDLEVLVNCLAGEKIVKEQEMTSIPYTMLPFEYMPVILQRVPEYAQQRHNEFFEEYLRDKSHIENITRKETK